MRMLLRTTIILAVIASAGTALGFGKPENSSVEASAKTDGKAVQLTFKVTPKDGHVVTLEAPWKLTLKAHDGLTFSKDAFNKTDMAAELPGFVVGSTGSTKLAGEVSWELAAFICTKDKTSCYREVHEGKTSWKTAETK